MIYIYDTGSVRRLPCPEPSLLYIYHTIISGGAESRECAGPQAWLVLVLLTRDGWRRKRITTTTAVQKHYFLEHILCDNSTSDTRRPAHEHTVYYENVNSQLYHQYIVSDRKNKIMSIRIGHTWLKKGAVKSESLALKFPHFFRPVDFSINIRWRSA